MNKHAKALTACAFIMGISTPAMANSGAAFAAIDWSSLDIHVYGDGGLALTDDIYVGNSAVATDFDFTPVSVHSQLFGPAFAGHPIIEDTGAVAGFDEEATAAAANATWGSAFSESNAVFGFETIGSGTAHITVDYVLTTEVVDFGLASAEVGVAIGADRSEEMSIDGFLFDGVSLERAYDTGSSVDAGTLSLLFEFSALDLPYIYVAGSSSVFAAGTVVSEASAAAVPVPAALSLMLTALGFLGHGAGRSTTIA